MLVGQRFEVWIERSHGGHLRVRYVFRVRKGWHGVILHNLFASARVRCTLKNGMKKKLARLFAASLPKVESTMTGMADVLFAFDYGIAQKNAVSQEHAIAKQHTVAQQNTVA